MVVFLNEQMRRERRAVNHPRSMDKGKRFQDPPPNPDRSARGNPLRISAHDILERVVEAADPAEDACPLTFICPGRNLTMKHTLREKRREVIGSDGLALMERLQNIPFVVESFSIFMVAQYFYDHKFSRPARSLTFIHIRNFAPANLRPQRPMTIAKRDPRWDVVRLGRVPNTERIMESFR